MTLNVDSFPAGKFACQEGMLSQELHVSASTSGVVQWVLLDCLQRPIYMLNLCATWEP
jgi:hypothetical protein